MIKTLTKFIDWEKSSEKVLGIYKTTLDAYAEEGEVQTDTEKHLLEALHGENGDLSEEMRQFLTVFYDAWLRLKSDERAVLREFYLSGEKPKLDIVMDLSEKLGYERTRIYKMRRDSINKFTFLLFKNI